MNITELRAALVPYFDDSQIGMTVYAVLKDTDDTNPVKLDIESQALAELKAMFLGSVRDSIIQNAEASVLALSEADERENAIYEYDFDLPEELAAIYNITSLAELPLLSLSDSSLSSVKALIFEIGNNAEQLVLYKTMAPINVFKRDSFFLLKSEHRLKKIEDEFLRISPGFQLLQFGDRVFVLDLKTIEKHFGFHDVVRREAVKGMDTIQAMDILENPESLRELIEDIRFARKLTRVARSSPVIQNQIPNNAIISFCKSFPKLAGRIRFNSAEDRIVLDTQVSKDLFVKLLMDDYLTSELTQIHYESLAKDSADEVVENP